MEEFGPDKTYDVIVAGAGPAGCVMASRLSERSDKQVLLIEAGPDAPPGMEHPDIRDPFPLSSDNPAFHWPGVTAEVEPVSDESPTRGQHRYIKGFGVGGGSNVNGMAADRGQPGDYDAWADLGAIGWDWARVLPFFKRMERDLDFCGATTRADHGCDGPMPVHRLSPGQWAPFTAAMGRSICRRGFGLIDDYMTDFRDGLSGVPTNSLRSGRVSASMAYLTPEVRKRRNLTVLANARVDRILLAERRANGLEVRFRGGTVRLTALETMLCCGAVHTPAILLRSGIGPRAHLRQQSIPVAHHLPGVGRNLRNHPAVILTLHLARAATQPRDNPWFLQNWLRFSSNNAECAPHDMHLMQFNRTAWHAMGDRVGMVAITVLDSRSTGTVELANAAPEISPRIRFNLLSDRRDEERLVSGLRFALELLHDPEVASMRGELFHHSPRVVASLARRNGWNALKSSVIRVGLEHRPTRRRLLGNALIASEFLLNNESARRDFVLRNARPQLHDCGTCRMGRSSDSAAVVDGTGRVHGIEALRIADASIFPTTPRGYPHFIVIMAAEKIADAVKAAWLN